MAAGVCLWALAVAAIACAVKSARKKRLAASNADADEEAGKNGEEAHQRDTGGEGGIEEEDSHTTSNPVPLTLAGRPQ